MKRAFIYVRVSTLKQGRGYSIPEQIKSCKEYAERMGYVVIGEPFVEQYTGTEMARPAWDALLAALVQHRIEIIIIDVIDRLARELAIQLIFEKEVARMGVRIEYASESNDDSDEGRLQKNVKSVIAEYERAKIIRRAKKGMEGKARSGYVVLSKPPYGYVLVSQPKKTWLEFDEKEKSIVNLIYSWFLDGDENNPPLTIRAISLRLTAMGAPTRSGGAWHPRVVHKILTNTTYAGKWYYNRTESVDHIGGKSVRRDRKEEDWIGVDVPAIITQNIFDQVQERLSRNQEQRSGRKPNREYLLRGLIRCAKCNRLYFGHFQNDRRKKTPFLRYQCSGRQISRPKICDMLDYNGKVLEETIWNWIVGLVTHPEQVETLLKAQQTAAEEKNKPLKARIATIDSLVAEKNAERERLLVLYKRGKILVESLEGDVAQIDREITALEKQKIPLLNQLARDIYTDEEIALIRTDCEQMARVEKGLHLFNQTDKRRYLERYRFEAVLDLRDGVKVAHVSCIFGQEVLTIEPKSFTPSIPR